MKNTTGTCLRLCRLRVRKVGNRRLGRVYDSLCLQHIVLQQPAHAEGRVQGGGEMRQCADCIPPCVWGGTRGTLRCSSPHRQGLHEKRIAGPSLSQDTQCRPSPPPWVQYMRALSCTLFSLPTASSFCYPQPILFAVLSPSLQAQHAAARFPATAQPAGPPSPSSPVVHERPVMHVLIAVHSTSLQRSPQGLAALSRPLEEQLPAGCQQGLRAGGTAAWAEKERVSAAGRRGRDWAGACLGVVHPVGG